MPIYEYACLSCGNKLQIIQRFSDSPLTVCELCGGTLKRLISAPAIHFKGTGWYVTDYARKGEKGEKGPKPESEPKEQKNGPAASNPTS